MFVVEFYNTINVQPRLLNDALFRQDCARQCRMRQPYTVHYLNFRGKILMKTRSCFFERLDTQNAQPRGSKQAIRTSSTDSQPFDTPASSHSPAITSGGRRQEAEGP